ncbi:uncharacterized protein DFL_001879 [Arthrobotrys flagrans]|uniref:DUF7918 domain-containing protein n=1 Tax=Arthrobotrys flagrans TaxID=97331 RepID=A0A437A984_ARTFL|nr:hypothetical protein DFL_001879 [Arthrobotrys flagrans]
MPSHKGITCTISVDGVPAEELGTEIEGSTITCSIISHDDKPFIFNLDFTNSTALRHDYHIYADGMMIANFTTTRKTEIVTRSSRAVNGLMERRKMRFSKFETVDQKSDEMETRAKILQNIGTFKVLIFRAEEQARQSNDARRCEILEDIKEVHEKSLKGRAVSHKTLFGTAEYEWAAFMHTRKLDPHDRPYVTFIFRYASKAYLQSEGLIPRSPSPEPSIRDDEKQSVEEMSPETLRRELLRYKARDKDGRKPTKREREPSLVTWNSAAGNDSDGEVVFQSARSVKKHKITEVIDLLSDD